MNGLVGLVSLNQQPVNRELFRQLYLDLEADQSPHFDQFVSPDGMAAIGRAHKRILHKKSQPAISSDGATFLFMEGEVFNEELDLTDQPQAVLDAYLEQGDSLFESLNGSFSFVFYNAKTQQITLVADRFATIPLFYIQYNSTLAFCAEIKPLLRILDGRARPDPEALQNYLAVGFMLDGHTLIRDIHSVRPGSYIISAKGEVDQRKYWEFQFAEQRDMRPRADLEVELEHLCSQAIRRQLRGDYRLGVPLSGGYDSRAILYYWQEHKPDDIHRTISWGNSDKRAYGDAWVAQQLADHMRAEHIFYLLNPSALPNNLTEFVRLDEGRTDAVGNYPESLRVFKSIRHELGIEILLRGNEIFGVQKKVTRVNDARHYAHVDDLTFFPNSYQYLKPEIYQRLEEIGVAQSKRILGQCPYPDPIDLKDFLYISQRYSGYQSALTVLKRKVIEERNPFLDNDIVAFVSRLPAELRVSKTLFRTTMNNQVSGFTDIGFSRKVSLINWDRRIKTNGELQNLISAILFERQNELDDLFDQRKLRAFIEDAFCRDFPNRRSIVNRANRKLNEKLDRYSIGISTEILRLTLLKVWVDEFLRGEFHLF